MEVTTTATKKTMGRRKIEIKKIEKKTSLQVTFAKRRRGLFRKASELSVLCGAEIAILVQSPADKIYAFAHPSVDSLINRLTLSPEAEGASPTLAGWQDFRRCEEGRRKYEEVVKALEMEKMREREKEMGGGVWWEEPYEGLELHELEEFLKALEDFGERVEERVKGFGITAPTGGILEGFWSENGGGILEGFEGFWSESGGEISESMAEPI